MIPTRHHHRRWGAASLLGSVGTLLFVSSEPAPLAGVEAPCLSSRSSSVSLLAVGDTGKPTRAISAFDTQRVVARSLSREHELRPVNALVLLGDNFYPDGLRRDEVASRVRDNLVSPYCGFLDLDGPRSAQVSGSCSVPSGERHPVPVLAVLGNHDYMSAESPRLQREAIPDLISNWSVPAGLVETHQLGSVSLILFDSELLKREDVDPAPLSDAIRRVPGPWRILVAHEPVGELLDPDDPRDATMRRYNERVGRAVTRAGVVVHVLLAGHEHNLQAIEPEPPLPPLVVVSGAGSDRRASKSEFPGSRFEMVRPGFVRVDLVDDDGEERLVISYIATARYLPAAWSGSKVVACWSVSEAGVPHEEYAMRRLDQ